MTNAQIANAVDRGMEIRDQIQRLKAELDDIETKLKDAGRTRKTADLEDPESEGFKFEARGMAGIVPIIYTSDLLMKSFAEGSRQHDSITASLGDAPGRLLNFFTLVPTFKTAIDDASQFRRRAREVLGAAAPAFLAACVQRKANGIPKHQERVDWDHAKPV